MLTKWAKAVLSQKVDITTGILAPNVPKDGKTTIEATNVSGSKIYIPPALSSYTYRFLNTAIALTGNSVDGFAVGSDGTPATENDYTLGNQILGLICSSNLSTQTVYDDVNHKYIGRLDFAISNDTGSDVVIREIGRFCKIKTASSIGATASTDNNFMLDRTVLDVPVTIPNGEAGIVRYDFIYN